jgi:hypothetical protein
MRFLRRSHILVVLLVGVPLGLAAADEKVFFGMDGADSYEEMESNLIPDSLNIAEVPGRLLYPSPNKRFAFNRPTVEQAEAENYEVTNHLVDLKTKKSVHEIGGSMGGDFESKNHGGMRVKWRADSRAALFLAEHKWEPAAFCLITIAKDDAIAETELSLLMQKEMLAELDARWPKIREALKLAEYASYDSGPFAWNFGCAFTDNPNIVALKGTVNTNGKGFQDRPVVEMEFDAKFDSSTGKLIKPNARIIKAGVIQWDDDGNEKLDPIYTPDQK